MKQVKRLMMINIFAKTLEILQVKMSQQILYLYSKTLFLLSLPEIIFQLLKQRLITSVFTIMKNYSSMRNVDAIANSNANKFKIEKDIESPMRLDLRLKLPNHTHSNQSNFKTKQSTSKSKEKEQQSTELLLTERTNGVNEFTLPNKDPAKGSNIKSYLRIKPSKSNASTLLEMYNNQTIVYERSTYKFDYIFQPETPQNKVYTVVGKEVTNNFLEGYNGTIFAYGSTGSGKTYTMFGNDDGLVPSVVEQIFSKIDGRDKIGCSMIEIYKENLIDLLSGRTDLDLKIKDVNNSCVVHNLSIHEVKTKEEALFLIKKGNILKKIRETDLNESSSRSHIVFTLHLEKTDAQGRPIKCKFNLVDLAGSQKVFKSKVQGEGLQQAKKINLSLSCLGNTISALVKNSDHIPYRESKLTRILKESLMGSSITRLIVTCCLNQEAVQETISSIKFAQRAQKVQTQAEIAYNIHRFKGQKQERQKYIKQAYDQLQADINKIKFTINKEQCSCNNCLEIKRILNNKPSISHVFSFNPIKDINSFKSPKEQIDLRTYFSTGSVEKFTYKKQQKKRSLVKPNYLNFREERPSDYKEAINKKIFDLKLQNEKLKEQKLKLETRVKNLQEKSMNFEKDSKIEKANNKKIIKLGQMGENRPSRLNKENLMNACNTIEKQKCEKKQIQLKRENTNFLLPIHIETQPQTTMKENSSQVNIQLINEVISKLQLASSQYRVTIYPIYLQILNQQVTQLQQQQQFLKSASPLSNIVNISFYFKLLIKLQKKMCNYIDGISDVMDKLFQGNNSQYKLELSEILHERVKEISDIKWNMKQFYQEYDQFEEISNLLQPTSKIDPPRHKNDLSRLSFSSMTEQNQFLSLNYPDPQGFSQQKNP